jgi:hypothetical protein
MSVLTVLGQSAAMFAASMAVGLLPLVFKGRMSGESSRGEAKRRRGARIQGACSVAVVVVLCAIPAYMGI